MEYLNDLETITEEHLDAGFFEGWPNPPSTATFYKLLNQSTYVWLAFDTERNKVAGFINAVSDKVLSAYIPLLEVLPEYRDQGIGSELVDRMLQQLSGYYMIDLLCDEDLQGYYSHRGMQRATGMMQRNYENQSGKA